MLSFIGPMYDRPDNNNKTAESTAKISHDRWQIIAHCVDAVLYWTMYYGLDNDKIAESTAKISHGSWQIIACSEDAVSLLDLCTMVQITQNNWVYSQNIPLLRACRTIVLADHMMEWDERMIT